MAKHKSHWGATLDEFPREERIRETAKAEALTGLAGRRLAQELTPRAGEEEE